MIIQLSNLYDIVAPEFILGESAAYSRDGECHEKDTGH